MKRKNTLLLIVLSFVIISLNINVYADDQITVTHDMLGDNNSLQVVRITRRVVNIEDGAFSGLTALKEIRVDRDNEYYASCNGCLYNKDYTVLICIPQNTKSVSVKSSITGYLPHALDGLEQSRVDKFHEVFSTAECIGSYTPSVSAQNNAVQEQPQKNNPVKNEQQNNDQSVRQQTIVNQPVAEKSSGSTDFSKYVYREGDDICFNYTGSGDSRIIIPDGVTKVIGFHSDFFSFNTDITYIYIPSSVTRIRNKNQFNQEQFGWDNNGYSCLYQCSNLRTVESASPYWRVDNNGLYQPLANGGKAYSWSPNQRIKYDRSIYYSSGSMVDSNGNVINKK